MRYVKVRCASFAPIAAATLLAGCAAVAPSTDRYVAPPIGSTWTYHVTATGSYGGGERDMQVRLEEGTLDGRKLYKFVAPGGAVLRTDTAAVVAVLGPGDRVVLHYDPPIGPGWPLEVGKTKTDKLTLTTPSGAKVPMTADWKVEAYEDVTVPAGTFKAWRISMADNFGYRSTIWSVPDRLGIVKQWREKAATHPMGGAGTELMELKATSSR
jgi:hypothetical protein